MAITNANAILKALGFGRRIGQIDYEFRDVLPVFRTDSTDDGSNAFFIIPRRCQISINQLEIVV